MSRNTVVLKNTLFSASQSRDRLKQYPSAFEGRMEMANRVVSEMQPIPNSTTLRKILSDLRRVSPHAFKARFDDLLDHLERAANDDEAHSRIVPKTLVLAASIKTSFENQRRLLQERVELCGAEYFSKFEEVLEHEMSALAQTQTDLAEMIEGADEEVDSIVDTALVRVKKSLDKNTKTFLRTQQDALLKSLEDAPGFPVGQVAVQSLGIVMETSVRESYLRTRLLLDAILACTLRRLIETAAQVENGIGDDVTMSSLPFDTTSVVFFAAQDSVSFPVCSKRRWLFWKKGLDVKRTVKALQGVTVATILPATNMMIETFSDTVTERAIVGKARLRSVMQRAEDPFNERMTRLCEDCELIRRLPQSAARTAIAHRLQSDIEVVENRLQIVASKLSMLVDLTQANHKAL